MLPFLALFNNVRILALQKNLSDTGRWTHLNVKLHFFSLSFHWYFNKKLHKNLIKWNLPWDCPILCYVRIWMRGWFHSNGLFRFPVGKNLYIQNAIKVKGPTYLFGHECLDLGVGGWFSTKSVLVNYWTIPNNICRNL